jgi:hypothetical protein
MTVFELMGMLSEMPMYAEVYIPERDGGAPTEIRDVKVKPPESWMEEPYVWLE